jgi:MmyB-like transcription regulator ligand binding domain
VLPLQLETELGRLSLFGTITVFGTPIDVTVAELALECFHPADRATAAILRRSVAGSEGGTTPHPPLYLGAAEPARSGPTRRILPKRPVKPL